MWRRRRNAWVSRNRAARAPSRPSRAERAAPVRDTWSARWTSRCGSRSRTRPASLDRSGPPGRPRPPPPDGRSARWTVRPWSGVVLASHWIRRTVEPSCANDARAAAQPETRRSCSSDPSRAKPCPATASTQVCVSARASWRKPTSSLSDIERSMDRPRKATLEPMTGRETSTPRSGPAREPTVGAAERCSRVPPDTTQRVNVGSHCSAVRPPSGQHARATDPMTAITASTTPSGPGRACRVTTPTTRPPATEPTWPLRHPAIRPRCSSGPKR